MYIKRYKQPDFILADVYPFVDENSSDANKAMSHKIAVLPNGHIVRGGQDIDPISLVSEAADLLAAYNAIVDLLRKTAYLEPLPFSDELEEESNAAQCDDTEFEWGGKDSYGG